MSAIQITKQNFEEEVTKSPIPVLVDFWAPWCGPCQAMLPVVEELSKELTNVKICKINTDDEEELAERFGVMSVPTFMLFKDGNVMDTVLGAKTKMELLKMIGDPYEK